MPKKINLCEDCNTMEAKKYKLEGKYLCSECLKKEEYKYITKSTITKEYFLNEKDIENLNYNVIKNPHYSSRSMYLYKLLDVKQKFVEKYGQDVSIENIQQRLGVKRDLRRSKMRASKINSAEQRENLLKEKMAEKKMKIRGDSKLCKGFIDGTIKEDVDDVVKRMCQVKYLFDYCNLQHYFDIAKQERREELEAGYFPDEPLFDHAERLALKDHGGFPDVYPWM